MPGTQCKLYRRSTEKAGKGRRIKKGRLGKRNILCSLEMMKSINRGQNVIVDTQE